MKFLILFFSYCYFYGIQITNEKFSTRINFSKDNFYLLNSFFLNLFSHSNGGAINLINNNCQFLIEQSIFYYCKVSDFLGGALYISCNESIVNFICGSHCSTNGSPDLTNQFSGMFGYIKSNNYNRNIFNYSSIQLCAESLNLERNRVDCLQLHLGKQNLYNFNSSKNFLHRYCSITFNNLNSLNSSFCNFFNGSCKGFGVILYYSGNINNLLSYSNFIKNYQTQSGVIQSHYNSKPFLSNCIFKDNNQYLFSSYTDSLITIINCYLIHSTSFYGIGNIIYSKIYTIETNTYKISFLSLNSCEALNPLLIQTFSHCLLTKKLYEFQKNYFFLIFLIIIDF